LWGRKRVILEFMICHRMRVDFHHNTSGTTPNSSSYLDNMTGTGIG
jgi:hypothetical protein